MNTGVPTPDGQQLVAAGHELGISKLEEAAARPVYETRGIIGLRGIPA